MKKQIYNILSIDAWADAEPGYWTWNNWYKVNLYHESEYGELSEDTAMQCFANKLGISIEDLTKDTYIIDDQYNMVLCTKHDHMPIYAIEYGNRHY